MNLTSSYTNNGTLKVDSEATLTNSSTFTNAVGSSLTVNGTLTNNGTLVLSGTVLGTGTVSNGESGTIKLDNDSLLNFNSVTYVGGGNSGFIQSLQVFESSEMYTDNDVYVGDTACTVTGGVASLLGHKTYYVNENLSYDSVAMAGATGFTVAESKTLSLNSGDQLSINTLSGAGSVSLASGATLTMNQAPNSAQSTPTLGSLTLNDNTALNIDIGNKTYYSIGAVTVSGDATIASLNSNDGWEFCIDIDSLTNDQTDSTEDTLSIVSNTYTANRSIVNINGGDFDGTINLTGSGTSDSRKLALNVNNASVLADTVVQMHGSGSHVALAVGADSITLKGIADQTNANGTMCIVSGAQAYDNNYNFVALDTTFRTLVINTNGTNETSYSTSAAVGAYLNLVKTGTGSQAFTGDMSAFNGTIEVQEGTLTIGAANGSTTTNLGLRGTIVNNGTLNLNTGLATSNILGFTVTNAADKADGFQTGNLTYIAVDGTGTVNLGTNCTQITVNGTSAALT